MYGLQHSASIMLGTASESGGKVSLTAPLRTRVLDHSPCLRKYVGNLDRTAASAPILAIRISSAQRVLDPGSFPCSIHPLTFSLAAAL